MEATRRGGTSSRKIEGALATRIETGGRLISRRFPPFRSLYSFVREVIGVLVVNTEFKGGIDATSMRASRIYLGSFRRIEGKEVGNWYEND